MIYITKTIANLFNVVQNNNKKLYRTEEWVATFRVYFQFSKNNNQQFIKMASKQLHL